MCNKRKILSLIIILGLMCSLFTSCRLGKKENPYEDAWIRLQTQLSQIGVSIRFVNAKNTNLMYIDLFANSNFSMSTEELLTEYFFPELMKNNDIYSYLLFEYGPIAGDGLYVEMYNIGTLAYTDGLVGGIVWYLPIGKWANLENDKKLYIYEYQNEIIESNLNCGGENTLCSIMDISEKILYVRENGNRDIIIYLNRDITEDEMNMIESEVNSIIDDPTNHIEFINVDSLE